ncbi:MAG TPA: hypothetical protein VFU47_12550 [Armatimonadota bacterium]|nr:hypothetical protein [Armatimonadota bacterium]
MTTPAPAPRHPVGPPLALTILVRLRDGGYLLELEVPPGLDDDAVGWILEHAHECWRIGDFGVASSGSLVARVSEGTREP